MSLGDEKYLLLTTYRKNGTPVATPVWSVPLDDGKVGFWTSSGSGKAKRLAHTAKVTVQPCDGRGKVKSGSQPIDATAELVSGTDMDEIRRKVSAKYGFMTKVTKLLGQVGGIVKRKRIPYGDRGVIITPRAERVRGGAHPVVGGRCLICRGSARTSAGRAPSRVGCPRSSAWWRRGPRAGPRVGGARRV